MGTLEGVPHTGVTQSSSFPARKARVDVTCQYSRGATGRVWAMPYALQRSASMDPADPMLQVHIREESCIQATIAFLGDHAQAPLQAWIDGMRGKLYESYEPLIRAALEYKRAPQTHEVRYDAQPVAAPPRSYNPSAYRAALGLPTTLQSWATKKQLRRIQRS